VKEEVGEGLDDTERTVHNPVSEPHGVIILGLMLLFIVPYNVLKRLKRSRKKRTYRNEHTIKHITGVWMAWSDAYMG
jgi:hypothetical protein